jgi:hypothetical protein
METVEFVSYPSIPRLRRNMTVTEKIDGTNASITIVEDGKILAGSRNRFVTVEDDNFGFAAWVEANQEELLGLGMGRHFGEWWGRGIQRGYGLSVRKFSLFNPDKWCRHDEEPRFIQTQDPKIFRIQRRVPACCDVVPVLYEGPFSVSAAIEAAELLAAEGSLAAPGFDNPEGIVVFHKAARSLFKMTLGGDGHKTKPE